MPRFVRYKRQVFSQRVSGDHGISHAYGLPRLSKLSVDAGIGVCVQLIPRQCGNVVYQRLYGSAALVIGIQ